MTRNTEGCKDKVRKNKTKKRMSIKPRLKWKLQKCQHNSQARNKCRKGIQFKYIYKLSMNKVMSRNCKGKTSS